MLFFKLLLSPMPHARVREHRRERGAGDARRQGDPHRRRPARRRGRRRRSAKASQPPPQTERGLTNEPVYQGEPILAVAAVDETDRRRGDRAHRRSTSSRCRSSSIRSTACGPAARTRARRATSGRRRRRRHAARSPNAEVDRRPTSPSAADGQLPMGEAHRRVGVRRPRRRLQERRPRPRRDRSSRQSTGHQPLETRTAMAYWQNGKLYLHGSTQSVVQTVAVGRALGRHRRRRGRAHQRVHRRRLRQQDPGRASRWPFRRCCRRRPTRR